MRARREIIIAIGGRDIIVIDRGQEQVQVQEEGVWFESSDYLIII